MPDKDAAQPVISTVPLPPDFPDDWIICVIDDLRGNLEVVISPPESDVSLRTRFVAENLRTEKEFADAVRHAAGDLWLDARRTVEIRNWRERAAWNNGR